MPEWMIRACLIALAACSRPQPLPRSSAPPAVDARVAIAESPDAGVAVAFAGAPLDTVDANGVTLHRGDHVRVRSRAGTAKPNETGHPRQVEIDTGRTGVFLGGRLRDPIPGLAQDDLAVIRWDAQTWHEYEPGFPDVALESFVSSIHPTYLELVR